MPRNSYCSDVALLEGTEISQYTPRSLWDEDCNDAAPRGGTEIGTTLYATLVQRSGPA